MKKELARKLEKEELRELFGWWFKRAKKHAKSHSRDEYWFEFLLACRCAKFAFDGYALDKA